MKHGDISNHVPPTIIIRVEETLLKLKQKKILGVPIKNNYEPVENTVSLIIRLSMKTDYRVKLVCEAQNFNLFNKILNELNLPFTHLSSYSEQTIVNFLNNGIYYCYIDDDLDRIGRVNHKSSYTVAEFTNLVL